MTMAKIKGAVEKTIVFRTKPYSGHCQTSMMELLRENTYRLLAVNYFLKKLSA